MTSTELEKLKEKIRKTATAATKAEAIIETEMNRLRTEHDCDSIGEAEDRLEELNDQQKELEQKLEAAKTKFEKRWNHVFRPDDESDSGKVRRPPFKSKRRKKPIQYGPETV